ncbi:MAG: Phosphatidylinositol glycan, class [Parcubacteria group bacterium]|nr:Phosphatidylinositol glycan, class [Parcubacteria group bacterium]
MNILFISNDPAIFEEGSAVRTRMRSYADEVAKTGGMLHILSHAKKHIETSDGPLVLHGVGGNRLLVLLSMRSRARALVRKENIAIVSAQDPFEQGRIALHAVRGTNAKLHMQLHTDAFSPWFTRGGIARSPRVRVPFLNRIRKRIADRILPKADGIRVVSQRIKDSLITRYGERMQKAVVIPIHVDTVIPPKVALPEPVFPFSLISVSRLEPEKRIEDILYALAGLKDSYPAVGLMIIGSGSQREHLEQLTKKLDIESRVRFLGARADARGLMQSAQAYIQASAYEGYGITLIEAALARIPIITTDVGIVGEVFKGNDSVLAAPPGDPAQLLYLIRRLVEDSSLRTSLAMRAETVAKEHLAAMHSEPADIIADMLRLAL